MQPALKQKVEKLIVSDIFSLLIQIVIFVSFVSIGRRTIEENNTRKYTKPIQFTAQSSSTDSTTIIQQPNSVETKQNNVPSQCQSSTKPSQNLKVSHKRKQNVNRHHSDHNDHLSAFCNKSLQPNKYANFIIFEMGGETNSFQILQASAAKQKAVLNVTYSMIGSETYVNIHLKCYE